MPSDGRYRSRRVEPRIASNVEVAGGAAVACDGTPGPPDRSTPEHDRVFDPTLPFVMGTEKRRGSKRRRPALPQTGDRLWRCGARPPQKGRSGDGRHLGCGGSRPPSRESVRGGPILRGSAAAGSGTRRRASVGLRSGFVEGGKSTPDDAGLSGRRIITSLRQEVSEPTGLG
jgi:hypothetical protein